MQEIEVRVLDINVKQIVEKIQKIGARYVDTYQIESVIFDTPKNDLHKRKEVLRLRKKNNQITLTHKSKTKTNKARIAEEIEITVSDFEKTTKILESLGFVGSKIAPKKRTTYKIKNSLIEIDEYEEIPPFFEIESQTIEELEEIVKLLGYTMKDTTTMNGWKVFEKYGKKLGRP